MFFTPPPSRSATEEVRTIDMSACLLGAAPRPRRTREREIEKRDTASPHPPSPTLPPPSPPLPSLPSPSPVLSAPPPLCFSVFELTQNLVRDPWSSPLTTAELASLDLVYVNSRLIAMGFPVDKRPPPPPTTSSAIGGGAGGGTTAQTDGSAGGAVSARGKVEKPKTHVGNDIDLVAALLRSRHAGHYMVWNVSEEGYDYSLFEDQVGYRAWYGSIPYRHCAVPYYALPYRTMLQFWNVTEERYDHVFLSSRIRSVDIVYGAVTVRFHTVPFFSVLYRGLP